MMTESAIEPPGRMSYETVDGWVVASHVVAEGICVQKVEQAVNHGSG